MLFGNKPVVQDHGVVLVRHYQLLISGHGTQGHEAVGNRGWAELFLAQLKQPLGKAAPDSGHGTADHVGIGVFVHHPDETVAHIPADLLQAFNILLVVDIADQVKAALALVFHNVGEGDHAPHLVPIHHRKVVHIVVKHGEHGFEDEGVRADGDQVLRHDVTDGCLRGQGFAERTGTQIPVGNDAPEHRFAVFLIH